MFTRRFIPRLAKPKPGIRYVVEFTDDAGQQFRSPYKTMADAQAWAAKWPRPENKTQIITEVR